MHCLVYSSSIWLIHVQCDSFFHWFFCGTSLSPSLSLYLSLSIYISSHLSLSLISPSISSHLSLSLSTSVLSFLFQACSFLLKKSWKKFWTCQSSFYSSAVGMEIKKCPSCFKKRKCEKKIGKNFVVLVPTISSLRFTFLLHQSIHPNLHYHLFITILNLPSHLSIVWAKLLH